MSRLTIVCGEPGVGKSKVAAHLSTHRGATLLRTDEIRKELFGQEPEYTWQESRDTYNKLFERTVSLLRENESVILDGTFMLSKGRVRADGIAQHHTTMEKVEIIRVRCDSDVVKERIEEREDGPSDADFSVYQSIRDRFETVDSPCTEIDNSGLWGETKASMVSKGLYNGRPYTQQDE